jgi:hypothetical protein
VLLISCHLLPSFNQSYKIYKSSCRVNFYFIIFGSKPFIHFSRHYLAVLFNPVSALNISAMSFQSFCCSSPNLNTNLLSTFSLSLLQDIFLPDIFYMKFHLFLQERKVLPGTKSLTVSQSASEKSSTQIYF